MLRTDQMLPNVQGFKDQQEGRIRSDVRPVASDSVKTVQELRTANLEHDGVSRPTRAL